MIEQIKMWYFSTAFETSQFKGDLMLISHSLIFIYPSLSIIQATKDFLKQHKVRFQVQTSIILKPYGRREKWQPPFSISALDIQWTTLLILLKASCPIIPSSLDEIFSQLGSMVIIANLRPSAGSLFQLGK